MSIGSFIRMERRKRGWSQEVLAKKLYISRTTLGKYERDERSLDLDMLNLMSKVFGFSFLKSIEAEEKRIYKLKERRFLNLLRKEKVIYEIAMDYPDKMLEKIGKLFLNDE